MLVISLRLRLRLRLRIETEELLKVNAVDLAMGEWVKSVNKSG